MDGYKNSKGESQMPIVLTKEGWKVTKPTIEELSALVQIGKDQSLNRRLYNQSNEKSS